MSGRAGAVLSLATTNIPENPASRQVGNVVSHNGGAMRAPCGGSNRPEGTRMSADLLRLLEEAYPGRTQADLLALIEATPDRPEKSPRMAQDGHSRRTRLYRPGSPNARHSAP